MRRALAAALLGSACLFGCVHPVTLVPGATAEKAGGSGGARTSAEGVQLQLETQAWSGTPKEATTFTPLKVSILNNSGGPLRVRLQDFRLTRENGKGLAALPAVRVGGVAAAAIPPAFGVGGSGAAIIVDRPGFFQEGFQVAPPYQPYYPTMNTWSGPFAFDPSYYDAFNAWGASLPSPDMVAKAVPEGVIEPGGMLSGFLYFPAVPKDAKTMDFHYSLVDAQSGEQFGELAIPLERAK